MWRELPTETREWAEEDWEGFFRNQDEQQFAEMQARPWEGSDEVGDDPAGSVAERAIMGLDEEEVLDPQREYDEQLDEVLNRMPAWRAAADFCDQTIEVLSPVLEGWRGGTTEFVAQTLVAECYLVADYVLAGHELGYDENTLCGNIALCVRSKRSLERCIRCLQELGGVRDERCRKLIVRALVTGVFLDRRIAELRASVWWR